jgi:hypothetical protein
MWACLDSNQGPLPYQRQKRVFQLFTAVQKMLQICTFSFRERPVCSPLFRRVVVKDGSVREMLSQMAKDGQIKNPRRGQYVTPDSKENA